MSDDILIQNEASNDMTVAARDLVKRFGQLKVLDGLTICIPRGTTYCLLGPNGSGKTTFIRSIVGLIRLDGGEMEVLGRPISRVREIISRIGYMTQHKALYPDLTLQENMEFYASLYGIKGARRRARIDELLEMVDLEDHRRRLAGDLSGGMYQRLSLACTLIHDPDLLLLDEPTVGVDPRLRRTFWEYFESLTDGGATILITTHLMDEAEKCRIVGYMKAGRLEAEGSPVAIKRLAGLRPSIRLWVDDSKATADLLASSGFEVIESGDALDVFLDSFNDARTVLDLARPRDLKLVEPTLEEAFLRLSDIGRGG
ncbi:MAG: ABC transporter ATP-binding protein [Methanotrichaceae archaeon]|nr:ABC transporter ATP-binding protein [Methanotrichaceae archaeon]